MGTKVKSLKRAESVQQSVPDLGGLPDTVERHCTDVNFLVFFIFCFAAWVFAMWYAVANGDFDRLGAFNDGTGRRCNSHKDKKVLYFCLNRTDGDLDVYNPVCAPWCPHNSNTTTDACGDGSVDYPAASLLGMVCMPAYQVAVSKEQARQLYAFAEHARLTVASRIVVQRYRWLMAVMGMSIFASYVEIYLLEYNASCLVKFGMITMCLGCVMWSIYLFEGFHYIGLSPAVSPYNFPGGVTLMIMGITFGCILASMQESVSKACDCIELACKCIMHTPNFMMLPLGGSILNTVVGAVSAAGCFLMLSCGTEHLEGNTLVTYFGPGRRIIFSILIIVWLWMHQVIFALSQFTIANAASLWYFRGGDEVTARKLPRWAILKAIKDAFRYHLGTCALGGSIVFLTRALRLPIGLLVSWTRVDNVCGRFFRQCCCGIDEVYDMINPLSKNAFIDVAMNSRPFFEAAKCADHILMQEPNTIRILNGATWVFQFVGLTANSFLGACMMIWVSIWVIGDSFDVTLIMAVAGAMTAGGTAFPFALIFDTVSDTILYCSEVEQLRLRKLAESRSTMPRQRGMVARLCPCVYKTRAQPAQESTGLFLLDALVSTNQGEADDNASVRSMDSEGRYEDEEWRSGGLDESPPITDIASDSTRPAEDRGLLDDQKRNMRADAPWQARMPMNPALRTPFPSRGGGGAGLGGYTQFR